MSKRSQAMTHEFMDHDSEILARQLADLTGEPPLEAIRASLRQSLDRRIAVRDGSALKADLMAIAKHCSALPDLDARSAEEILGYDENGLPS